MFYNFLIMPRGNIARIETHGREWSVRRCESGERERERERSGETSVSVWRTQDLLCVCCSICVSLSP